MKSAIITFLFLIVACTNSFAKKDSDIDSLITIIGSLQCKGDAFYHNGLFPSERKDWIFGTHPDNNIFFNILIAYILQSNEVAKFSKQDSLVKDLITGVKKNLPRYYNHHNDYSYNFYQTKPDNPLPFFTLKDPEKLILADDFDDTSLAYCLLKNDSCADKVKSKMKLFTNNGTIKVKSTFKKYKQFNAYPTWFGKQMPQDFDMCVLSNTLLFVFESELPLNEFDSATVDLLYTMFMDKGHLKRTHLTSASYINKAVIMYHLSRLFAVDKKGFFAPLVPMLIEDLKKYFKKVDAEMEKILIATSLLRLGEKPFFYPNFKKAQSEFDDFVYFVANPTVKYKMFTRKILGKKLYPKLLYRSEAFNWALIVEYLVLLEKYD